MGTHDGMCGCGRPTADPDHGIYRCYEHMGWQYQNKHERHIFRTQPDQRKCMAGRANKRYRRRHGTETAKAKLKRDARYGRTLEDQRMRSLPGIEDAAKGAHNAMAKKGFTPGGE